MHVRATGLLAAVFILLTIGCLKDEGIAPAPAKPQRTIEVRGANGAMRVRVEVGATAGRWTAASGQGAFSVAADGALTASEGGGPSLQPASAGVAIADGDEPRLRLSRADGRVRIADGQGFPLGRAHVAEDGKGVLHDAAGMLRASATSEGGRVVVADRDARVLGYVVGVENLERAVTLFLTPLTDGDVAMLAAMKPALWP